MLQINAEKKGVACYLRTSHMRMRTHAYVHAHMRVYVPERLLFVSGDQVDDDSGRGRRLHGH